MTQPLAVKLSSGLPRCDVDTIAYLVELSAEIARAPLSECEVHVKYSDRADRSRSRTTGYAYYNYDRRPFSEQAYVKAGGRSTVNVHPAARYLVTLKLWAGYAERNTGGPWDMHYAKYKTFPHTTLYTWEEEFVYVATHEFKHIEQFERPRNARGRASASEYECELAAIRGLTLYRAALALAESRLSGQGRAASQ